MSDIYNPPPDINAAVNSVTAADGTLTITPNTGTVTAKLAALPSADILVGNASNVATAVVVSGDATLANTGALTVTKTSGVSFGTAATQNTGTSGATIPLLNGTNTWSGVQSFNSGDHVLNGATSGSITLNAAAIAGSNTITLPAGTTNFSATGGASQVVKQTSSGGAFTVAQLAAGDISGLATSATTDTTNASNISSGTLAAARLPNPSASTLGGIQSIAAVSHNFLTSISTSGVPAQAQPAFTDISGTATSAQLPVAAADGATKGIATFNATNFTAPSGVVNTIQGISTSASPQFATLGLGVAANTYTGIYINPQLTGNASANAIQYTPTFNSDVTSAGYGVESKPYTSAVAFTLSNMYHFYARGINKGAGSSVTLQAGYTVDSGMTTATTNYGFYGTLATASGSWNLYMSGTATNYLAGNTSIGSTTTTSLFNVGSSAQTQLNTSGVVNQYNNVATTGGGIPAIYGYARAATGRTAAATFSTYTVGAADGSFMVSANVLITTSTLFNFTVTCSYTDEGNTARVLTLQFSNLAGTLVTAIANAAGAVPYEGVPLHIRCKASTTITIASAAGGTYTTVTYNGEGCITQIA